MNDFASSIEQARQQTLLEARSFVNQVLGNDNSGALLTELLSKRTGMGLVVVYEELQNKARELKASNQEIPEQLVQFIHKLGAANSGLAGLTVYETYFYEINKTKS